MNKRVVIGVAVATVSFLFLSLIGVFPAPPGFSPSPTGFLAFGGIEVEPVDFQELCFNGQDDNINGLIDCADPECFTSSFCAKSTDFLSADEGITSDLCDPILVPENNKINGLEFCVQKAYKKCVLALKKVKKTVKENSLECSGDLKYEYTDLLLDRCSNVVEDYNKQCVDGEERQLMQKLFICCK